MNPFVAFDLFQASGRYGGKNSIQKQKGTEETKFPPCLCVSIASLIYEG